MIFGHGRNFCYHWGVCETMDFFILAKENSPSTLNRKGWISMPKPYLTSQQLRQYVFPICYFPTNTKDMKGTKFMQSILKELYPNLLKDFKSMCGLWFFLV